jgi:hypothetical protein
VSLLRRQPREPAAAAEPAGDRGRDVHGVPAGYHVERVLVADRDTRTADYLAGLQGMIGDQLSGRSGRIVGHDLGAPERSLTGAIAGHHDATASAIAGVIQAPENLRMSTPEYGDSLGVDAATDPVRSLLYSRIQQ